MMTPNRNSVNPIVALGNAPPRIPIGKRTRYIVGLISRGIDPKLAESLAFIVLGNPLQEGGNNA